MNPHVTLVREIARTERTGEVLLPGVRDHVTSEVIRRGKAT